MRSPARASAIQTDDRPRLRSYRVLPEPFASPAIAEVVGTDTFRLLEDFRFQLPAPDGRWVTIPRGFVTDLASVPPLLQSVVSKTDLGVVAPLVHDWALRCGAPLGITTEMADDLLEHLCERQQVAERKARLAVKAVRAWHFVDTAASRVIDAQSIMGAVAGVVRAVAPVAGMALIPGGRVAAVIGAVQLGYRLIKGFRETRAKVEAAARELAAVPRIPVYIPREDAGQWYSERIPDPDSWPVLPTAEQLEAEPLRFLPDR